MTLRLYSCFNFILRSEIELTELYAVEHGEGPGLFVDIRLGVVPKSLQPDNESPKGIEVDGNTVLLHVTGTARYLIRDGREIIVDAEENASPRNLRLFLLGSALGIICLQRGLLPLHANAVIANDGVYAFAGVSGSGKSTLAAYFVRTGYQILTDDVCVISFDGDGKPLAWPGLPRIKLWGDASAEFGHDTSKLERAIEGLDKYHVPFPPAKVIKPLPFRRLYLLQRAENEDADIVPLRGHSAMQAVMANTYRRIYVEPMGLGGSHFRMCAALLAEAEVFGAKRVWGYDRFDGEAAKLERHMLEGGGQK